MAEQQDFDFWEFISCARCRMPFSMENSTATVPFWLTECGHIICNNHLNPDQSCAQCGSEGIQLTPLQREMEAPMSEWFQSIPHGLESIMYAVKFQQEIMASQIRYHKSRHQQLRQLLERLKREVMDLKKDNDTLRRENEQYRIHIEQIDNHQMISDTPSSNNKRQIVSTQQLKYPNQRLGMGSSPTMPLGPQRLTMQPGQPLREMASHKREHGQHIQMESTSSRDNDQYVSQRPQSTRSLEQYAYTPQKEQTFRPPPMTYVQHTSKLFQNGNSSQHQGSFANNSNTALLPPPTSSRFKPALNPSVSLSNNRSNEVASRQTTMGPPPTPLHVRNQVSASFSRTGNEPIQGSKPLPGIPNKQALLTTSQCRENAVPPTPVAGQPISGAAPRRFFQTGGASRPSNPTLPTGGHRTPFVSRGLGPNNGFV